MFAVLLRDVSVEVKGLGTVVAVNCGHKDGKKFCKKMKVGNNLER